MLSVPPASTMSASPSLISWSAQRERTEDNDSYKHTQSLSEFTDMCSIDDRLESRATQPVDSQCSRLNRNSSKQSNMASKVARICGGLMCAYNESTLYYNAVCIQDEQTIDI